MREGLEEADRVAILTDGCVGREEEVTVLFQPKQMNGDRRAEVPPRQRRRGQSILPYPIYAKQEECCNINTLLIRGRLGNKKFSPIITQLKNSPWIQPEHLFREDEDGSNRVVSSRKKKTGLRALSDPLGKYNAKVRV